MAIVSLSARHIASRQVRQPGAVSTTVLGLVLLVPTLDLLQMLLGGETLNSLALGLCAVVSAVLLASWLSGDRRLAVATAAMAASVLLRMQGAELGMFLSVLGVVALGASAVFQTSRQRDDLLRDVFPTEPPPAVSAPSRSNLRRAA